MGYLLWALYGTERFLRAGGCSRSGNKKTRRPVPECRKCSRFRARKAAPFLCRGLFKPPDAKRRTQYFLLSDLPHRWIYFDYDQGPLSCVHLPVFVNSAAAAPAPGAALAISFFIIAPQKNGVNPKAKVLQRFLRRLHRNKTPFSVLRHTEKGVLLGYCLGVRRNHVTWEVVAAPLPMAKV